jgi:hypothetical protein
MQESEDKGSPISPTDNHVATLFFMLSHYIADAHMPLHCDNRTFANSNDNTWDYMTAITQYSYLLSYKMLPSKYSDSNCTISTISNADPNYDFNAYSKIILSDAIISIAKVWFRVWNKYQKWLV